MGNEWIDKTNVKKDLGVWIIDNFSPEKHINKITGDSTYQLLRNIRMAFKYLDEEMINKLITSLLQPKLEYTAVIWSPHKKDLKNLERIQRATTKMAPSLRDLPYEERISRLKLPTLEKRRERGDFIAVYRVSKYLEKIDRNDLFVWDDRTTRGQKKKLKRTTCKRDIEIYSFPNRNIEASNKLHVEVINA